VYVAQTALAVHALRYAPLVTGRTVTLYFYDSACW